MSLVNNREVAYEALFLGELPYEPQPNEQDIGLSGLWRAHTAKVGAHGNDLNDFLGTIPATVSAVLSQHDIHAYSEIGADGQAVFGLVDPTSSLPIITNIVTRTVSTWEKSLWRNKYDSITPRLVTGHFTEQNQSLATGSTGRKRQAHRLACKSLIVETAAAAMTVLPLWAKRPLQPTMTEQQDIAKVLANWGPQFTVEWLEGSILDTWLQAQDLTAEDKQQWQKLFNLAMLRNFAVRNINDPMSALDRVKTNLELMTDEVIANRLGWGTAQVNEVFSPARRKHFAVKNINNPLAALDRVKTNLELLTDDVIAKRLGWGTAQVNEVFTPALRKYFAVGNINNPLAALDRVVANLALLTDEAIANRLGWDEQQVRDTISPYVRKHFAVGNINNPLAALDRVKANLELLTDDVIADRLGWGTAQVNEVFSPATRKYFAVSNINNPLAALDRVKTNLELLTDDTIADRLGWGTAQVKEVFTPTTRKYFAVKNINNPLTGIEDYAAGRITFGGGFYLYR